MTKRQIKEELTLQAALFERRVRSGQVLDGHVTFAEFVERWRRDYAELNLSLTGSAQRSSKFKLSLSETYCSAS